MGWTHSTLSKERHLSTNNIILDNKQNPKQITKFHTITKYLKKIHKKNRKEKKIEKRLLDIDGEKVRKYQKEERTSETVQQSINKLFITIIHLISAIIIVVNYLLLCSVLWKMYTKMLSISEDQGFRSLSRKSKLNHKVYDPCCGLGSCFLKARFSWPYRGWHMSPKLSSHLPLSSFTDHLNWIQSTGISELTAMVLSGK